MLIIQSSIDFLSSLFSSILVKTVPRRVSILLPILSILISMFILLIANNSQTIFVVSITTRVALQVYEIALTIKTIEEYPTEVRGTANGISRGLGVIGALLIACFT
jgi:nitrate/nitrite transporter NarK